MKRMKIGIIGTGNICGIYMEISKKFPVLDLVACADIIPERARAAAEKYQIPRACSVEEIIGDPEIQLVINLTPPIAHFPVALACLENGKSVYNEKPMTLSREDARHLLDLAQLRGLRIGCAPDTFLGSGLQTCRKLIDEGAIGDPVSATAFMLCHGHESWHPDPEFYYQAGGGPMFDMGPYYLTALVSLLGPVKRISGSVRITYPERLITSQPKFGKVIKVEVPTHVAGILDFNSGAVASIITSFDVWAHHLPFIEIYGSKGSLSVPDPNTFGGPVQLWRSETREWENVDLVSGYPENSRSLGVADMATAILSGRPHRANGTLGYHVLDIMHGIHDASVQGQQIEVVSTCSSPAPLVMDLPSGILDE